MALPSPPQKAYASDDSLTSKHIRTLGTYTGVLQEGLRGPEKSREN